MRFRSIHEPSIPKSTPTGSSYFSIPILILILFRFLSLPSSAQTTPHSVSYFSQWGKTDRITLHQSDEIKYPLDLPNSSILYMQNNNGKIIVVKGPLRLTKKEAEKKFVEDHGISKTYFSYVVKKMTTKASSGQNSFGGVSRGDGFMKNVFPMSGEVIGGDEVKFVWTSKPGVSTYYFSLFDNDENVLLKVGLRDTSITILPAFINMNPEEKYYWSVSDVSLGENTMNSFVWVSVDSLSIIKAQETSLLKKANENIDLIPEYLGFLLEHKQYTTFMEKSESFIGYAQFHNMISAIRKELEAGNSDD